MDSLISVIVPVYNSQQYLKQCVASIAGQTYVNLEIILVDDGSWDNSPMICDSLAKTDHRIRVIHKENGGASDARNQGVLAASGQYVTFVDCDDWIHREMLSVLSGALEKNAVNLAMCGYQVVDHEKNIREKTVRYVPQEICTGKQMLEKTLYQKLPGSSWAILLSKELALETPFPKGCVYGEDLATVCRYFWKVESAVYLPGKFYFYRDNPHGLMRRSFHPKMFDLIKIADEIANLAEQSIPELLPAANARKYSAYAQVLQKLPAHVEDAGLAAREKDLWRFLTGYRWKMLLDPKARIKNRVGAFCTLFGKNFFKRLRRTAPCQPQRT